MQRRALILANGAFADAGIPPLMSPVTDGGRLRDLLSRADVGGFDVDFYADATSIETRIAVQRFFASAGHDDLTVVLISGHGLKDRNGKLYFATSDTQKDLLSATALPSNFVIEQMDESQSRQKVLFIDTCYSGAFVKGMTYKSGAQTISNDDFEMGDTSGRAIITASSAVEVANENNVDGTTQSVFTRHLIEGIETGKADRDGQGSISLDELFFYVKENLKREAPGQTPQPFFQGLTGKEKIVLNPIPPERDLPKKLQTLIASKDRLRRGAAVEDLQKLIEMKGPEAKKAMAALQTLQEDDSELVRGFAERALASLQFTPATGNATIQPNPEPAPATEPAKPISLFVAVDSHGPTDNPAPADTGGLIPGPVPPPKKSPHEMTPQELLKAGMLAPKRQAAPRASSTQTAAPGPESTSQISQPQQVRPPLTAGTVIGRIFMVFGVVVALLLVIGQCAPVEDTTGIDPYAVATATADVSTEGMEALTPAQDAAAAYETAAPADDAAAAFDAAYQAAEEAEHAGGPAIEATDPKF